MILSIAGDFSKTFVQFGAFFVDILYKFWDFFKNVLSFLSTIKDIFASVPVLGPVLVLGYYIFIISIFVSVVVYLWKFITGGVK